MRMSQVALLAVLVAPIYSRAGEPKSIPKIDVLFSPHGGCTERIIGQKRCQEDVLDLAGGSAKVVRRHPGTYPASARRGQHGTFIMTRQAPQSGPRCENPGAAMRPPQQTRVKSPPGTQGGARFSP